MFLSRSRSQSVWWIRPWTFKCFSHIVPAPPLCLTFIYFCFFVNQINLTVRHCQFMNVLPFFCADNIFLGNQDTIKMVDWENSLFIYNTFWLTNTSNTNTHIQRWSHLIHFSVFFLSIKINDTFGFILLNIFMFR